MPTGWEELPSSGRHEADPRERDLGAPWPDRARRARALCHETCPGRTWALVCPIAEAHFAKHAWFRAIYADKVPVGFIMLHDTAAEEPGYLIWRLMVGGPYQGMGFGRRAVELLIDYVRTRPGAKELLTSCGLGEGSPEGFYLKVGFRRTGEMHGHEAVLSMPL